MFWGDRMGNLTDPFGHSWAIATHKEDVSPEEMEKRMTGDGVSHRLPRFPGSAVYGLKKAGPLSTNGAACSPKIGPWPPFGTTHSDASGIPRNNSTACSTG